MDNEYHITRLIGEDGVLVACRVVEEQYDVVHGFFTFPGRGIVCKNNHNHEFSDTLINQLFQEQQPSNFQRNTIPPLAIIFAINWSVGYWWRQSGY